MSQLSLDHLPDLPQAHTISFLASRLWRDDAAVALWIGGSLARGAGDQYSDVDLRLAVRPPALASWQAPDFGALLEDWVVGRHFFTLGNGALLHHLVLRNGDITDLLVQSIERAPIAEPRLVLGCRDAPFAQMLSAHDATPTPSVTPATPESVRELVVSFWINSHKHRKVLHRSLDLMIPSGLYHAWMMLMRLWFIQATGEDATAEHFGGIHGLTTLVKAVEDSQGPAALALFGAPVRTREEICAAIERQQTVVARVGRLLAERYAFDYPTALELTVTTQWREFTRRHRLGVGAQQAGDLE